MSIKVVTSEGTTIFVDKQTDVDCALYMLEQMKKRRAEIATGHPPTEGGYDSVVCRMINQLNARNSNLSSILEALASTPEGLTDAELRDRFGFRNNTSLNGAMSSISRLGNGRRLGELVVRERKINSDGSGIRYSLAPHFLEAYNTLRGSSQI